MPKNKKAPAARTLPKNHADYLTFIDDEFEALAVCEATIQHLDRVIAPNFGDRKLFKWGLHNALAVSTLIWVRNLNDFLASNGTHPTDMRATDFLPGWSPKPPLSDADRVRVHKQIAHLTYDRKPDGDAGKVFSNLIVVRVLRALGNFYVQIGRKIPPSADLALTVMKARGVAA